MEIRGESGLGNPLVTLFTFWNKVHSSYFPSKSFNYDLVDIRTFPPAPPTSYPRVGFKFSRESKRREPESFPGSLAIFFVFPSLISPPFCLGRRFQE